MELKKALLNNIVWRVAALVFVFINNIIIVRLLGAEASGQFFYTIAYLTLIITIFRFGLENGITFIASKYPQSTIGLFWFLVPFAMIQGEIVAVLLKYIPFAQQQFAAKIATLYIVANILFYYVNAFYKSRKMFLSFSLINLFFTLLQTVYLAVLFYLMKDLSKTDPSVPHIVFQLMAYITALNIIFLILYYFKENRNDFGVFTIRTSAIKGLFQYSGLNFLSTIILFLLTRIDFYFVEKYCSAIELSNYVQASKIGQMLLLIPGLIGGVVFPFAIRADDSFAIKVGFLCKAMAWFFGLAFLVTLVAGPFIFPWLLGKEFSEVHTIILLQIAGVFFASINLIIISFFEAKNKQILIFVANIVILIILVLLDVLFVPTKGYKAAALAFTLANFVGTVILLNRFFTFTNVSLKRVLSVSYKEFQSIAPSSEITEG